MEDILNQVSNLGFPIVMCIYLLVRFESKMDKLTESIQKLSNAVELSQKALPSNNVL